MKHSIFYKLFLIAAFIVFSTLLPSCRKNLLNQIPATELAATEFWKTEADATTALMGAYNKVREVFERDYLWDGIGEFVRNRNPSYLSNSNPYDDGNYVPAGFGDDFDKMFEGLFGAVNRCNYVIENVSNMLPEASGSSLSNLEAIVGEAKLLRGMVYLKLISMWGDVPYISKVPTAITDADTVSRTAIRIIKDSILADFTYAAQKLPNTPPALGRAAKPAAIAFRGKMHLYWASWNKYGWPELEGFTPSSSVAATAFAAAAADFKSVINDFGLTLYMNGDPGSIDELGKAEILPNYYHLFTPKANGNPEMLMVFTHGGVGTNQGEDIMRDVGQRSHEFAQGWLHPRFEIADRYQLITTGDYAPKLIPRTPSAANRVLLNSAINPQSYANRDYRMKSSIMWDYEMSVGLDNYKITDWTPFIYKTWRAPVVIDGRTYITLESTNTTVNSGYIFRKFLRNYPGQDRNEGDFAWPAMRLADVYLMYAEAVNEVTNGAPDELAIDVVNRVRRRGNLPPLAASKTTGYQNFFDAIEQERIIELFAEGHRPFDLRRWRKLEQVWGGVGGPGVWRIDTHGANQQRYYQNATELDYQRAYIFRIPLSERDRNPRITQNIPWR